MDSHLDTADQNGDSSSNLGVVVSRKSVDIPPANRLEKLAGDRKGQYSIRINKQFRLCFIWNAGIADAVEVVDYH